MYIYTCIYVCLYNEECKRAATSSNEQIALGLQNKSKSYEGSNHKLCARFRAGPTNYLQAINTSKPNATHELTLSYGTFVAVLRIYIRDRNLVPLHCLPTHMFDTCLCNKNHHIIARCIAIIVTRLVLTLTILLIIIIMNINNRNGNNSSNHLRDTAWQP